MDALVVGITGYAGSHIARELLERGHRVTGLARDPDAGGAPEGAGLLTGSVHDSEALSAAAADADAIVVALPAREIEGRKLIDAVGGLLETARTNTARLGLVGGAGSSRVAEGGPRLFDTPDFPDDYKPEARAHADILDRLRTDGGDADWFVVSPAASFGSYNPGERTGSYRTGSEVMAADADGVSAISGADYAIAFVDELESPVHRRERFTVGY